MPGLSTAAGALLARWHVPLSINAFLQGEAVHATCCVSRPTLLPQLQDKPLGHVAAACPPLQSSVDGPDGNCLGWAALDDSGTLAPYKFSRRQLQPNDVMIKITHAGGRLCTWACCCRQLGTPYYGDWITNHRPCSGLPGSVVVLPGVST
jgi:hypothetical protein